MQFYRLPKWALIPTHTIILFSVTELQSIQDTPGEDYRSRSHTGAQRCLLLSRTMSRTTARRDCVCYHRPLLSIHYPIFQIQVCLFSMMLVLVPDVPRTRSGAGSKLKGLGVQNASKIRRVSLQPKDFGSLVDVFVYRRTLINLRERAVRR